MAFVKVWEWDKIYDLYDAGLLWGQAGNGPLRYLPPTAGPASRIRSGTVEDYESYGYMTED